MANFYRHYKGGLYAVIAWATDEPTMEPVVVYRSEADGRIWVRTRKAWEETVHIERLGVTRRVPRFSPVVGA